MKRVALYVRVSTDEQVKHGISIDAQISALTDYANENNYTIHKIYADEGISARKSYKKRPALLEMISDCQKGFIDLILICKLDRFFRSVPDYYAVMEQIGSVPWKTIHEDYETETSTGVFKVNIMLSVAQSEADRTSERIKKAFEYKKSIGEITSGKVSYGFKIENKKWIKDPAAKKSVETFYKHYLSTFQFKESYEIAKNEGMTCSYRMAFDFLKNPRYYGSEKYITEAYITKEQFDIIQKNRHTHPKTNKFDYIFRGVLKCGLCGCMLSGHRTRYTKQDGSINDCVNYICSRHSHGYDCNGSTTSEKFIENYLIENLNKELSKYNLAVEFNNENIDHKHINGLRAKLTRLKNLYEIGDMDFEEYKTKRNIILDEIKKNQEIHCKVKVDIPSNWLEIYKKLDIPHKNAFWLQTLDHIEINGRNCVSPVVFF